MSQKPLWRQAVEGVDGRVSRHLDRVVAADEFAVAVGLAIRARRGLVGTSSRLGSSLLHAVNLPSKGDVDRLLLQLASVEREVRRLQDAPVRRAAELGSDDAYPAF